MYAVIATGGKQQRVSEGEVLAVELLGQPDGTEVSFTPVLLVDGPTVLSTSADLAKVAVKGKILGTEQGPKIHGGTYKNKTNQRRRWGHRQSYSTVEITSISAGA